MRTRGLIAALLVGASSVLFAVAWPTSSPAAAPAPVAEEDRLALFEESLDQQWDAWFGVTLPLTERPEVQVVQEVAAPERDAVVARCVEAAGWEATDYLSRPPDGVSIDAEWEALLVDRFVCEAGHPSPEQIDYLMSAEQRSALYDYNTVALPMCFALTGAEIWDDPPTRDEFIEKSVMWPLWTPHQAFRETGPSEEEMAAVERRCPSDPAWRPAGDPPVIVG